MRRLFGKLSVKEHYEGMSATAADCIACGACESRCPFHVSIIERMEKARDLILQGLPLESVGKAIGYQDHSTFYRAFRQTYGVSPREYRKNMQPGPAE